MLCTLLHVNVYKSILTTQSQKNTITESFQYFDKEYLILDELVVSRLFLLIFGLKIHYSIQFDIIVHHSIIKLIIYVCFSSVIRTFWISHSSWSCDHPHFESKICNVTSLVFHQRRLETVAFEPIKSMM